jgi:hypothetical protein
MTSINTQTAKLIVFIVLLIHGIGHFQGTFAGLGLTLSESWNGDSPILGRLLSSRNARLVCLAFYTLAGIFTLMSAFSYFGVLLPGSLFKIAGVFAVILSVLSMIFFWHGLSFIMNKLGAVAVNILLAYLVFSAD